MRSLVSHTKSGYPFGILEIRKNRSVGAIIAENRNKTKEKTSKRLVVSNNCITFAPCSKRVKYDSYTTECGIIPRIEYHNDR